VGGGGEAAGQAMRPSGVLEAPVPEVELEVPPGRRPAERPELTQQLDGSQAAGGMSLQHGMRG
jgi:hypothetical protein